MKRHLTQKCTPLLALFLSLALLLSGMVPLSYFSFAAAEFSAEASAPEAAEEPTALYELTELRQADTKYIQMSDGTVRALVYDTAVHRPDGQEGYTEIDNRLSEKGDGVENADARINDITPIIAEDLEYGQKSTGALLQSDTKISLTDLYKNNYTQEQMSVANRIDIINTFFKSQLSEDSPFNDILAEMIDHLVDGTGTDYSNNNLTSAVVNHPKTIAYVDAVVGLLNNYLSQNSGNISGLYYDENLWTNPILRSQHPMVNAMAQGIANGRTELQEPYYGYGNGVPGLTLAIDSWYGNKFEIVSFNKSGNSYSGTLRFSFYDHFGLDTSDLEDKKYGNMQAGFAPGFRQWYILQHWSGLAAAVQPKPFVTKVSFTIPFQGTYN